MYDTLVGIEADPKKEAEPVAALSENEYGDPEVVQNLMPRRY